MMAVSGTTTGDVDHQARMPELQQLSDPDFWRRLAPRLTVEGNATSHQLQFTADQEQQLLAKMGREAYVHLSQPGLDSPLQAMRDVMAAITGQLGLPPVFAFAYDEFWMLQMQIRPLIRLLLETDDIALMPDFWAWRVSAGKAGWQPHRDRPQGSLFPNGKPKSLSVWIPLSIAHPLNGCIYIVPADRDVIYAQESSNGFRATLPDIRALPAEAGDALAWTQRLFHWGSAAAAHHDLPPRHSVAFEFQRCDVDAFDRPLLDPDQLPPFRARIPLIAKQVVQYTDMYGFTPELVAMARELLNTLGLPRRTAKTV